MVHTAATPVPFPHRTQLGAAILCLFLGCSSSAPDCVDTACNQETSDDMDPSITIVTPEDGDVVPLTLDEDGCRLEVSVTVEVKNFTLREPNDNAQPDAGHWHLAVDGGLFKPLTSEVGQLPVIFGVPGDIVGINADLRNDLHEPLDQFPDWKDRIEVVLGDPPTGTCD